MKEKIYIASCSFGKDSIATILLALEHNEPLDRAVFAEVMFDHSRGISGEIPEHIDWIYSTAIPKLEGMGVKVDIVRDKKDYVTQFYGVISKGKYEGKIHGFPMANHCTIQRDMKLRPIHAYYKQFADKDIIQYVGIAADEKLRLLRLRGNKVSLMDRYGCTEADAMSLCKSYGLLSPIYETGTRGGCWFCPNMRPDCAKSIRQNYPELWEELSRLAEAPNKACETFRFNKTFAEVNAKLDAMDAQQKLF